MTIRDVGELDGLDLLVLGLTPNQEYGLYLVGNEPPEMITALRTDAKGNGMGQATGTLQERLLSSIFSKAKLSQLVVAPRNAQNPVKEAVLVVLEPCC